MEARSIGMSLRQVPKKTSLEVEFSYPLAHLSPSRLHRSFGTSSTCRDVRRDTVLSFDRSGFMHGFIDLLFRFKDRFYLID